MNLSQMLYCFVPSGFDFDYRSVKEFQKKHLSRVLSSKGSVKENLYENNICYSIYAVIGLFETLHTDQIIHYILRSTFGSYYDSVRSTILW
jgi:hypothetical protein